MSIKLKFDHLSRITERDGVIAQLERYKKTPRKRPDWASMMKEIESGKKLKRVETNDRSRPILPKAKAKGKVLSGQTTFMPTDDTTIDGDPLKEVVIPTNHISSSKILFILSEILYKS